MRKERSNVAPYVQALAFGARAVAAVTFGTVAIGLLAIRKVRFGDVEIDRLVVRRLTVEVGDAAAFDLRT